MTAISQLPPTITPTLPPAPPTGYSTTPSGLLVPGLVTPGTGGLVVAQAGDIERAPQLVAARLAELAAQFGAPAADALLGAEQQLVDAARSQIEHDRIIAAFTNGGLDAAVAAARAQR